MVQKKFFPRRELAYVNPVFLQDPGRTVVSKVVGQYLQDEGQTELPVWNDEIWKDRVGMPAGSTEDPKNSNPSALLFSIGESDQVT